MLHYAVCLKALDNTVILAYVCKVYFAQVKNCTSQKLPKSFAGCVLEAHIDTGLISWNLYKFKLFSYSQWINLHT